MQEEPDGRGESSLEPLEPVGPLQQEVVIAGDRVVFDGIERCFQRLMQFATQQHVDWSNMVAQRSKEATEHECQNNRQFQSLLVELNKKHIA